MIVTHGICDKCRKKEERMEAGLNNPAYGTKKSKETGMKILSKLLELMGKAGLLRGNRERVLQEFMPFLGISPETQRTLIREMTGPGVEDTESPFAKGHGGQTPPDADDDYGVRVTVQRGRTDTSDCLPIENKERTNEPEDETEGE